MRSTVTRVRAPAVSRVGTAGLPGQSMGFPVDSGMGLATMAGLCSAVLLTTGCTAGTSTDENSSCPVTRPTSSGVPEGVREQRYGAVFGQGALWVGAWWADRSAVEQVRHQRPHAVKYPSFTVRDGAVTSALGPPLVQATRLDGTGEASGDTGGYASATQDGSDRTLHWWPTVVTFSSRGCWQITETVGGTSISYVVRF